MCGMFSILIGFNMATGNTAQTRFKPKVNHIIAERKGVMPTNIHSLQIDISDQIILLHKILLKLNLHRKLHFVMNDFHSYVGRNLSS